MEPTGNEFFDNVPIFTIKIALSEIGHFSVRVIFLEATEQNLLPPNTEALAYELIGFEYIDNKPHLIFECKAFTDAAEMFKNMPLHWGGID